MHANCYITKSAIAEAAPNRSLQVFEPPRGIARSWRLPSRIISLMLVVLLSYATTTFGQQNSAQPVLTSIKGQVNWLKSMQASGKIDPKAAEAQIKALEMQAGELALGAADLSSITPAPETAVPEQIVSQGSAKNQPQPPAQPAPASQETVSTKPSAASPALLRASLTAALPDPTADPKPEATVEPVATGALCKAETPNGGVSVPVLGPYNDPTLSGTITGVDGTIQICVKGDARGVPATVSANDKTFKVYGVGLFPGDEVRAQAMVNSANGVKYSALSNAINVTQCQTFCELPMTHFRGLVGINVAGASGADPSAKFYANGAFELPLGGNFNWASADSPAWLSAWGNLALSSIAQPGTLSGVTDPYAYLQGALSTTPQQIVQSIESQVGLGINPPALRWFHGNSNSMQTMSFIVGGGVVTPLSPSQAVPTEYVVTQNVVNAYLATAPALKTACNLDSSNNLPTGSSAKPCYVAFYPQDRTRFFRDYGAGVRLKFYWTDSDGTSKWMRFPGNIDVLVGQSQYVTGGSLRGAVLHVGGAMPIIPLHGFYVFGSMDVALSKGPSISNEPLLLPPSAGTSVAYTDPSVVTIQVAQPNRDRYSIGMGIDVVELINHYNAKKAN